MQVIESMPIRRLFHLGVVFHFILIIDGGKEVLAFSAPRSRHYGRRSTKITSEGCLCPSHQLIISLRENSALGVSSENVDNSPTFFPKTVINNDSRHVRRWTRRRRRLPRTKNSLSPNNQSIFQRICKSVSKFALETILVGVCLIFGHYLASTSKMKVFSGAIITSLNTNRRKFVITNLTRWITASITLRLIRLHSQISASFPSIERGENENWFLSGSFAVMIENEKECYSGECEFDRRDETCSCKNSLLPVMIRQVPGDGSCLFHSIAAGELYHRLSDSSKDNTTSFENANAEKYYHDSTNGNIIPNFLEEHQKFHHEQQQDLHPSMSKILQLSPKLRIQAVNTLQTALLQTNSTLNNVIQSAAIMQYYGLTPNQYLEEMRLDGVWGGVPEIAALADSLGREIVLLQVCDDVVKQQSCWENGSVVYLKVVASFGSVKEDSAKNNKRNDNEVNEFLAGKIWILSANENFPQGKSKDNEINHFLAVFPSL